MDLKKKCLNLWSLAQETRELTSLDLSSAPSKAICVIVQGPQFFSKEITEKIITGCKYTIIYKVPKLGI